jgi:hypothetical protein
VKTGQKAYSISQTHLTVVVTIVYYAI